MDRDKEITWSLCILSKSMLINFGVESIFVKVLRRYDTNYSKQHMGLIEGHINTKRTKWIGRAILMMTYSELSASKLPFKGLFWGWFTWCRMKGCLVVTELFIKQYPMLYPIYSFVENYFWIDVLLTRSPSSWYYL